MTFAVSRNTLESIEWPRVLDRLRGCCRTPQGRRALDPAQRDDDEAAPDPQYAGNWLTAFSVFAAGRHEVFDRIAETTEARALIDAGEVVPLGGVAEMETAFTRATKHGTIPGLQLLDVRSTLLALHETARFFASREQQAPKLAERATRLV
jgi:dsDNA-specific endonuclease/ATPase MutS2